MNYRHALKRIDPDSCNGNLQTYLTRLYEPWPQMDSDVDLAKDILIRHAEANGFRLPLAGTLSPDGQTFTLAAWKTDIITAFADKYPDEDERRFRTLKTLSALQKEILPPEPN